MTTPQANVLRTLVQALVAFLVAIPAALALVPIPDKYQGSVALVLGIAAGAVVLVTAVQNAIEARAGVALFRQTNPAADLPGPRDDDTALPRTVTGQVHARGPP